MTTHIGSILTCLTMICIQNVQFIAIYFPIEISYFALSIG